MSDIRGNDRNTNGRSVRGSHRGFVAPARRRRYGDDRGFMALDVLIGLFIGLIVIGGAAAFFIMSNKSATDTVDHSMQMSATSNSLNRIVRDLRAADTLLVANGNEVDMQTGVGNGNSTRIYYKVADFDPSSPGLELGVRTQTSLPSKTVVDTTWTPTTIIARRISTANPFTYFDRHGNTTATVASVARVGIAISAGVGNGRGSNGGSNGGAVALNTAVKVNQSSQANAPLYNGAPPTAVNVPATAAAGGSGVPVNILTGDTCGDGIKPCPYTTLVSNGLTFVAGQIPAGVTISAPDPNTGVVTVTAASSVAPGTYTIGYTIADNYGSASANLVLTVTANLPQVNADIITVYKGLSGSVIPTGNDICMAGTFPCNYTNLKAAGGNVVLGSPITTKPTSSSSASTSACSNATGAASSGVSLTALTAAGQTTISIAWGSTLANGDKSYIPYYITDPSSPGCSQGYIEVDVVVTPIAVTAAPAISPADVFERPGDVDTVIGALPASSILKATFPAGGGGTVTAQTASGIKSDYSTAAQALSTGTGVDRVTWCEGGYVGGSCPTGNNTGTYSVYGSTNGGSNWTTVASGLSTTGNKGLIVQGAPLGASTLYRVTASTLPAVDQATGSVDNASAQFPPTPQVNAYGSDPLGSGAPSQAGTNTVAMTAPTGASLPAPGAATWTARAYEPKQNATGATVGNTPNGQVGPIAGAMTTEVNGAATGAWSAATLCGGSNGNPAGAVCMSTTGQAAGSNMAYDAWVSTACDPDYIPVSGGDVAASGAGAGSSCSAANALPDLQIDGVNGSSRWSWGTTPGTGPQTDRSGAGGDKIAFQAPSAAAGVTTFWLGYGTDGSGYHADSCNTTDVSGNYQQLVSVEGDTSWTNVPAADQYTAHDGMYSCFNDTAKTTVSAVADYSKSSSGGLSGYFCRFATGGSANSGPAACTVKWGSWDRNYPTANQVATGTAPTNGGSLVANGTTLDSGYQVSPYGWGTQNLVSGVLCNPGGCSTDTVTAKGMSYTASTSAWGRIDQAYNPYVRSAYGNFPGWSYPWGSPPAYGYTDQRQPMLGLLLWNPVYTEYGQPTINNQNQNWCNNAAWSENAYCGSYIAYMAYTSKHTFLPNTSTNQNALFSAVNMGSQTWSNYVGGGWELMPSSTYSDTAQTQQQYYDGRQTWRNNWVSFGSPSAPVNQQRDGYFCHAGANYGRTFYANAWKGYGTANNSDGNLSQTGDWNSNPGMDNIWNFDAFTPNSGWVGPLSSQSAVVSTLWGVSDTGGGYYNYAGVNYMIRYGVHGPNVSRNVRLGYHASGPPGGSNGAVDLPGSMPATSYTRTSRSFGLYYGAQSYDGSVWNWSSFTGSLGGSGPSTAQAQSCSATQGSWSSSASTWQNVPNTESAIDNWFDPNSQYWPINHNGGWQDGASVVWGS